MSILTRRSALRLQLAELDASECADCGHRLEKHLPSLQGKQSFACKFWEWTEGYGRQQFCKCKQWKDVDETLFEVLAVGAGVHHPREDDATEETT